MMFELTVVHRECGSLTLSRFTALFVEVGTKQSIAQRCERLCKPKGATPWQASLWGPPAQGRGASSPAPTGPPRSVKDVGVSPRVHLAAPIVRFIRRGTLPPSASMNLWVWNAAPKDPSSPPTSHE